MDQEATAAADSFAISVDCSNDFSATIANTPPPGASTVWTDEKHRLYLSSLEASFVNELHHYIGLRACLQEIMQRPYSSRGLPAKHCNSSHEVRDSDRIEPLLASTADSGFNWGNPLACHFTSSDKQHTAASHDPGEHASSCGNRICVRVDSVVSDELARRTEQVPSDCLFHLGFGSTREASDQNFEDEGQGEELFSVSLPKRLKTHRS